mgnify:CR=1 FL=1|tara:strand:- start:777 stop:1130 length:354 start_codon:yes stop_codon:yes gene_type:complete
MKIFVYGTLMKGEFNNSILRGPEVKYIGKGITKRNYTLYSLGPFPGMVSGGSSAIVGEIYKVDDFTLRMLDGLESHPTFYKRTKIELQGGEKVQTYILNEDYLEDCEIIKSGDWKSR